MSTLTKTQQIAKSNFSLTRQIIEFDDITRIKNQQIRDTYYDLYDDYDIDEDDIFNLIVWTGSANNLYIVIEFYDCDESSQIDRFAWMSHGGVKTGNYITAIEAEMFSYEMF